MPKPIKVMIEVEETFFGRVFRALDGMEGVATITPIGDGPRSQRQGNGGNVSGQKKGGAQSVQCILLKALIRAGEPTLRSDLGDALVAAGKTKSGLATSMKLMLQAKEVTRSGAGKNVKYKVTAKGIKRFETACEIQPAKE